MEFHRREVGPVAAHVSGEEAEADDGGVGAEQRIGFSLTADHRVIDGADAARFLSFVKSRLEEGDFGGELGL